MAIQFYLDVEGRRRILPIVPGEITILTGTNHTVTQVVKLGDVNVLGEEGLQSTSFSSYFPKHYNAHYINKKSTQMTPSQWVKILETARDNNQRVRLIVTETNINIQMAIDTFDWGHANSIGDIEYTIALTEHKDYSAKYVKTVKQKVSPAPRPQPPKNKPVTIGCEVIVNGRLHRDSYGTGPGQTEKNARRKVNFISKGRSHPYHVTTLGGGWRGWVTAGSVRRV